MNERLIRHRIGKILWYSFLIGTASILLYTCEIRIYKWSYEFPGAKYNDRTFTTDTGAAAQFCVRCDTAGNTIFKWEDFDVYPKKPYTFEGVEKKYIGDGLLADLGVRASVEYLNYGTDRPKCICDSGFSHLPDFGYDGISIPGPDTCYADSTAKRIIHDYDKWLCGQTGIAGLSDSSSFWYGSKWVDDSCRLDERYELLTDSGWREVTKEQYEKFRPGHGWKPIDTTNKK